MAGPVKIAIVAIGRLARSPETELVKLYAERATNAGRARITPAPEGTTGMGQEKLERARAVAKE